MEVETDLHDYILQFDNAMPEEIFKNFKKICINYKNFEEARVIDDNKKIVKQVVRPLIRKTSTWPIQNINTKSLTQAHWANILQYFFKFFVELYQKQINSFQKFKVDDIQILKYGQGGHYKFHTDYNRTVPRAYSCIFLVNEDYEGGELVFQYPNSYKVTKISKKENKMIIWPSNFLYPHSVMPVTKGERYSVVSWAS